MLQELEYDALKASCVDHLTASLGELAESLVSGADVASGCEEVCPKRRSGSTDKKKAKQKKKKTKTKKKGPAKGEL